MLAAIDSLAGASIPASTLESMVLPARVSDYAPAMLDELTSAGEVIWCGRGRIASSDGWISLAPVDSADLLLPDPTPDSDVSPAADVLLASLANGGSWLFRELLNVPPTRLKGTCTPRSGIWCGLATSPQTLPRGPRSDRWWRSWQTIDDHADGRPGQQVEPCSTAGSLGDQRSHQDGNHAWPLVGRHPSGRNPTQRAAAVAHVLLDRYGIVTRGAATTEGIVGGFAGVYRVLSHWKTPEQLDVATSLRGSVPRSSRRRVLSINCGCRREDQRTPAWGLTGHRAPCSLRPRQPYGAALPWPI